VVDFYIGTDTPSAATTDIWVTDGNTVHVTGTGGITSFGTAASAGARRTVIVEDEVEITNSSNILLPGGLDYTTEAGDILEVYAETTTVFAVVIHRKSGKAVKPGPLSASFLSSAQTITTSGLLTLAHGMGVEPKIITLTLQCLSADLGYSIGDRIQAEFNNGDSGQSRVNTARKDSTNIYLRYSDLSQCFASGVKSTGDLIALTNSRWALYVEAFA
jgi:hypothetical protein